MELLLVALGSCTGVDVVSILKKKREDVIGYKVEVRGLRRAEHPRSYQRMEVHHIVTGRNIAERSVAQAIELSEDRSLLQIRRFSSAPGRRLPARQARTASL